MCPQRTAELGLVVWSQGGIKILGIPVGSEKFVQRLSEERIAEEEQLWHAIPCVPDLQVDGPPMCQPEAPTFKSSGNCHQTSRHAGP